MKINARKWGKALLSTLLGASLLWSGSLSVHAEEAPSPSVPQISAWSVPTLNEGEKYAIFPLSWYYDGSFQNQIDQAKLQTLLTATSAKLDALGLKKTPDGDYPAADPSGITRDHVLVSLYELLDDYELPQAFGLDNAAPVDYLKSKGIVNGTNRGLELDQPCTVEQAAVFASRLVEYTYETAQGGAKGLFWKVTNDKNTLYLLGSIHIGIPEMYPFRNEIKDAFEQADSLWVEANTITPSPEDQQYFMQMQVYADGTTLKDHISKETYEKLEKVAAKVSFPVESFEPYQPWVVTNNLSLLSMVKSPEELGTAVTLGLENYFISTALLTGKPIQELEGIKLQADVLGEVTPEQQEKELNELLDSILDPSFDGTKIAQQFKQAQLDWAAGNIDKFNDSLAIETITEGDQNSRLLGERDKNMAKKLAELLEAEGESTHFVLVGAAHFVTKGMVLDQLKDLGYKVEFVK
ncbi:TraB/GumN family protein [Paenibacillus sp. DYY-L-2]|uniref:TraB/GumN family protein n=1 Tax=Paenibacillus sp. DYY-L-2 TaxID=3447013 RepID=UPI003F504124